MVYANVIVGSRTNVQALTYAVPASIIPYISVGGTVTVPLRQQSVRGVVLSLSRSRPRELIGTVREIEAIDRTKSGFSQQQIQAIEDLAAFYGASLAEVAYHALRYPSLVQPPKKAISPKKPLFIQAPWPDRLKFYQDTVTKYAGQRSIVLAFPTSGYLKSFQDSLAPKLKKSLLVLGRSLKTERILNEKLVAGEPILAAGLQAAAFLPTGNSGIFIIESPDHVAYKQLKRPLMTLKRIVLTTCKYQSTQLVMGANLLSVTDYPRRINKDWRVIEQKLSPKPLTIFSTEEKSEPILPRVVALLSEQLAQKQRSIVLEASKAWATALYCRNCRHLVTCPNCQRTIALSSKTVLGCLYCAYRSPLPSLCPNCQSPELVALGEGTARISEYLKSALGTDDIEVVSSTTKAIPGDCLVTVATERILSFPAARFELAVVANIDRLLAGTDPDGTWQLLNLLLHLQSASAKLIIQTNFPDHWVWVSAGTGQINRYFRQELADRQKYHLPPFGQKLGLIGRSRNLGQLDHQAKLIRRSIEAKITGLEVGEPRLSRVYGSLYQLTIGLFAGRVIDAKTKQLLRSLLPLSWTIDLEP